MSNGIKIATFRLPAHGWCDEQGSGRAAACSSRTATNQKKMASGGIVNSILSSMMLTDRSVAK